MKKIFALMLALLMVVSMVACGGEKDTVKTDDKQVETPVVEPEAEEPQVEEGVCQVCGAEAAEITEEIAQALRLLDVELSGEYCQTHIEEAMIAEIDINSLVSVINYAMQSVEMPEEFSMAFRADGNNFVVDFVFGEEMYAQMEEALMADGTYDSVQAAFEAAKSEMDVNSLFNTQEVIDNLEELRAMGADIQLDAIVVAMYAPAGDLLCEIEVPVDAQ